MHLYTKRLKWLQLIVSKDVRKISFSYHVLEVTKQVELVSLMILEGLMLPLQEQSMV